MNMRKYSLYLGQDQIRKLKRLSSQSRRSSASLLREAVDQYLKFESDPESCGIDITVFDATPENVPYAGE